MLERHLKKANLSPDDKQDIIAAERARRKIGSDYSKCLWDVLIKEAAARDLERQDWGLPDHEDDPHPDDDA